MGYHIFSLITGEELYFINGLDSFAYLGWGAFDGNPLLDATIDTLILPGENGVIYLIKLNTNYDKLNETIYIVKSGDTLYSIANKYNTSVSSIVSKNNLNNNILTIGQKLII